MSENVRLKASDSHELDAYVSWPSDAPILGLVVLQEAFGVNRHIRSVTDSYAKDGFLAIAPALYDRMERGVELEYQAADLEKGIALARQVHPQDAMTDVAAALAYLRKHTQKPCGVIGYCLGGTMAWLAATRLDGDIAIGYYGGGIARFARENPRCPVMLHFGTLDKHIRMEDVERVQAAHPEVRIFWYQADHGFNCGDRASYHAVAAQQARDRSLEFLKRAIRHS